MSFSTLFQRCIGLDTNWRPYSPSAKCMAYTLPSHGKQILCWRHHLLLWRICIESLWWASQVVLVVKNLPANTGDVRDTGSIPGSGKRGAWQSTPVFLPGESHGQRSLAGYWAVVHGITKSRTQLKWLSMHAGRRWRRGILILSSQGVEGGLASVFFLSFFQSTQIFFWTVSCL